MPDTQERLGQIRAALLSYCIKMGIDLKDAEIMAQKFEKELIQQQSTELNQDTTDNR
jgi:NTP pyrophosphatase (non-canonical NTP hydrolase)